MTNNKYNAANPTMIQMIDPNMRHLVNEISETLGPRNMVFPEQTTQNHFKVVKNQNQNLQQQQDNTYVMLSEEEEEEDEDSEMEPISA